MTTIARIEGIKTLWKGVSSVIVGAGKTIARTTRSANSWLTEAGPAHAVYFGTYEIVKEAAGGNVDNNHHPFAAGSFGPECISRV